MFSSGWCINAIHRHTLIQGARTLPPLSPLPPLPLLSPSSSTTSAAPPVSFFLHCLHCLRCPFCLLLPQVEFLLGDLTVDDWSDATMCFANSTCFDAPLMKVRRIPLEYLFSTRVH